MAAPWSPTLALKPSFAVCDISMHLMNGMEAARIIKAQLPDVMLVFLTLDQDPDLAAAAFRMGGRGCFSRLQTSTNCRLAWRWSGPADAIWQRSSPGATFRIC